MANIDFSSTPVTITLSYTAPDVNSEIATAPGGYNAGTVTIKDTTITGIGVQGYKTNNVKYLKSGQEYKFTTSNADEVMYYRSLAKIDGMTVKIGDTVVDPADVAAWGDLANDTRDVVIEENVEADEEAAEDDEEGEGPGPDEDPDEDTPTLSVAPTELSIVKGESGTATISNATGTVTAESDKPSITVEVEGTTVTVTASANAAASATVTLTDEASNTATIAVTTTDE